MAARVSSRKVGYRRAGAEPQAVKRRAGEKRSSEGHRRRSPPLRARTSEKGFQAARHFALQGQMRPRAPGQLGKITLPFRLASNKTRRAIAVFRAAAWPGGDLPRRKEAVKGVRVMEQKERETSLRELLGALMATCAGESNELVILAGANLTAISICMDAESSATRADM